MPETTPTWIRWETLTKRQFDAIDREKAVVLRTCSPLEVHGPHLPLGADVLEGEGLDERTLRFLPERASRRTFLKLPFVYAAVRRRAAARLAVLPAVDDQRARRPRPLAGGARLPQRDGLELPRQPAPLPGDRDGLRRVIARARHPHGVDLLAARRG